MSAPVESAGISLADLLSSPVEMRQGQCHRHGHFQAMTFCPEGSDPKPRCPMCEGQERDQVSAEARKNIQAEKDEIARRKRIDKSGIPRRMLSKRYADYEPPTPKAAEHRETCQAFATNWTETYERGRNLILAGKPGTGKTHLASAVCKQIIAEARVPVRYTTTTAMLRHIRSSYSKTAEHTEADAIDEFAHCPLLVLDEVGVKLASDHDRSLLFEVIDIRYQEMNPTILISNLTVGEIAEQTDERLVDRLIENGQVLLFDWPSHRGSASA